jgi:hypothetical protein
MVLTNKARVVAGQKRTRHPSCLRTFPKTAEIGAMTHRNVSTLMWTPSRWARIAMWHGELHGDG